MWEVVVPPPDSESQADVRAWAKEPLEREEVVPQEGEAADETISGVDDLPF